MAGSRQRGKLWRVKLISLAVASCFAREAAFANPTGPVVVNGQVTFHQQGNLLQVTNSPGSIINWQSFSIGANELTRFLQQAPSSAVLNRVVTQNPSAILGALQSNGRVFLINPSGILFGAGAQIDVAGLVASTLKLSDADFLAGRMRFTEVAGAGSVINQGAINTAQGGQVYLVGPAVTNQGIITSPKGEVILAAGNRVELVDPGTPNLRVEITAPDNQAVNLGQIVADAGRVGIHAGLINHSGTIRADSAVVTEDGRIVLRATKSVALEAGSLTSASGANGGEVAIEAPLVIQTGDVRADGATGGSVSVQAENFLQSAALSADGTQGAGGSVSVRADRIIQTESAVLSASGNGSAGGTVNVAAGQEEGGRIFSSATFSASGETGGEITVTGNDVVLRAATLDASGENGGGTILVGGDWQGGNPDVPNSRSVHVNFSTTLRADARQRGDGGKVVVWSNEDTQFFGSVSARGGAVAGDGGRIEVSGKENLVFGGHADAGAPNGRAGMLLLDPKNITIDASAGPSATDLADPNPGDGDRFGAGAVVLTNGNIVAPDSNDSFVATNGGAVYEFNGTTGGLVSTLLGSNASDFVGSDGVTALTNGNYVVSSPNWNGGRGAVTWRNGTVPSNGTVSATNSLIGGVAGDLVGVGGVTALTNGNYVVSSPNWNGDRGAVTWRNGTVASSGAVGITNSLTGSVAGDQVGNNGVTALDNGNYVVSSLNWNGDRGAVTWRDGTMQTSGMVGISNSLIGRVAGDMVGSDGVTALNNGNYVVSSTNWSNNGSAGAGAVTWGNGSVGTAGEVSGANSLVGSNAGDLVGIGGVYALTNGNYVVSSFLWNNGLENTGAVTWVDGATGTTGPVNATNSMTGSSAFDMVGMGGVTVLKNGNYVVSSPNWNGNRGAVTWLDGSMATTGTVTSTNSLTGEISGDSVGSRGVTALANSNYVVSSPDWSNNGAMTGAGAVTWGNGTTGTVGTVSVTNSLTGASAFDQVGSGLVTALTNGNFVVNSPNWNSSAGAATWGNGSAMTSSTVTSANSLVGTNAGDRVGGDFGVTALANGNYVVRSPNWNGDRGAVTWGNGATGATTGEVSSTNSLIGTSAGDQVGGFFGVTALANGNYIVSSPDWNLGQGAATWGNGATGVTGAVSSTNSLTGTGAGDLLGSGGITEVSGNRVLVGSPLFDNGAMDSGRLQIYDGSLGSFSNPLAFSDNSSGNVTITPSAITAITNTGTAVTLQANNDVTLNSAITSNNPAGNGGALTVQAGRSILLSANITTDNGNLTLVANETAANGVVDAHRDPGNAVIAMAPGTAIDTGTGNLSITLGTGAGLTNSTSGTITLQSISGNAIDVTNSGSTPGSGIAFNGPVNAGGTFTATTANSGIALNANLSAAGAVNLFGSGSGVTLNGNIVTAGAGVTIFDNVVLGAAPTVLIDTTNGGAVPGGRTIVVQGTINDDATDTSLALRAGTSGVVSLIGDVGGTTPIEGLTVISANVARLPNVWTREVGISVSTAGSTPLIRLLGNFDTTQGSSGAGNVTLTGPVELLNDVQIRTDHLTGVDGNVAFVGAAGTINGDVAGRSLTIDAGGDVSFGGAVGNSQALQSLTASGQSISLNGGVVNGAVVLDAGPSGSISLGGSLTAGNLSATAGGGIADNTGTSLAVGGNANFSGGNIELGENPLDTTHFGSLTINSTGAVNVTEDSAIVLAGSNTASRLALTSAGAISDAAGTGLTVTNNASFTGTSITLADNTSDVLSVGGIALFNATGGGITLGTAGTVNLGSLTFTSTDAVNIAEDSAMVLTGTNTAGNLTLAANGGSITQADGTVTANALALVAETGISLPTLAVTSVQATNSTSGGVTLSDAGGLSVTGISNVGGAISVSTTGGLTVDGNVDSGANATSLTSTGGSIVQTGGGITAGSAVLNSDTGISLTAGSIATLEATNNASGDISVTGMSGPLTAGAGGIDNFAAAGNVTLATTGALSLAGDVTVQPGQTISLSGGTIGSTGGDPVADTLLLASVNGATLANVVANRLSAVNTGGGNINLGVQSDVEIIGSGLVNAGGDATLTVPGNLTLGASVNAAGTAALSAGGSITQTSGTVAGSTVTLSSTNGSIGTGTSGRVNTQAVNLAATANNGGVFISELDSVNLAGGSAGAGGFDLVAGGALAVNGNVTSTGALNLASVGFSNNATISGAGGISIDAGGGAFTNNAGGVIAGSGTLDATGTTFTNNGTLRPGGAGAVGTLTVIGDAAFNGTGTIEIEALGAAAGQYDVMAVTSNAGLGGTLNVINMGGYVPANGDVLVPVTFASGTGAFIIVPASVFTTAYNANNLTLTVGEVIDLINRWIGTTGNWAIASNWSLGHIPTSEETVVVDVPGLQTITVSGGELGAFKLTSEENFRITGGQLALGGPSTFGANLTITGGTLSGSGNVVVNGNFNWTGGKLSGPGTFTTTGLSTLTPRWRDLELRRDWINLGTIDWRGTNGRDLYIVGDTTLLNAYGGTLNLLGGWGSDIKGDGELANEGTVNKKGNQTTTIKTEFENSGTLRVMDGELRLKDSDGNDGAIEISKHATLDVNGPGYANRGVISGTGTLDVKDTRFVNEGTVAPGSSGGAGIGTLRIAGNYRQSASGTLLMDAASKKSGKYDRLEVTGKATLDGTLTVNAVGGYVPRKGDTLELITYKARSGTFSRLDGPDGYYLRSDYDRRSAKFMLKPE